MDIKGKKIEFNTGRGYSKDGQVIKAQEFNTPYEDMDFFEDKNLDQYIVFEDITRGIKGRIDLCRLSELDIMRNYDSGNYENVC